MAMQYLEGELRNGNQKDQAYADIIAGVLKARGKDVALPKAETAPAKPVATPEEATPVEIKRFSDEDREYWESKGRVIVEASGSLRTQREAGRRFRSTWFERYPEFEAVLAMNCEVAIDPNELFIKGSNNKILNEQQRMVEDYSGRISKERPGSKAVMGNVADYTSVAFDYFDKTNGERLFGEKYDYNCARTTTPVGSGVALVGIFNAGDGLHVDDWDAVNRAGNIFAAPLVVPA